MVVVLGELGSLSSDEFLAIREVDVEDHLTPRWVVLEPAGYIAFSFTFVFEHYML